MKYSYDLHIHSALSPCCENENTPVNILAKASLDGLQIVAVSDHNAIHNVEAAMEIGEMLDILVVPAVEIQTNEDVHLLCLFGNFENLEKFYNSIEFIKIANRPDIFGHQYIVDSDDKITGELSDLLLMGCSHSESEIYKMAIANKGIAVPAHIDREENGMLKILGGIPDYYRCVEISDTADENFISQFKGKYNIIINSDSHCLMSIGKNIHFIDLEEKTAANLIETLIKGNFLS